MGGRRRPQAAADREKGALYGVTAARRGVDPCYHCPMPVAIDSTHLALMRGAASIHVASRNADNVASVARALGCRVADDVSRVTTFLWAAQARDVLADLQDCREVAVVFSRPSTHRTIQLKGEDACVGPLAPGDLERIGAYVEAFVQELSSIGYAEAIGRTLLAFDPADVVAVSFTPDAAFRQTPGPDAGAPLR
jgi:hypothetical protein